jgi:hypothetical protein
MSKMTPSSSVIAAISQGHRADCLRIVLERLGLQVDVACWSALVESGQQDPALQHEPIGESRARQSDEERLQDVEL